MSLKLKIYACFDTVSEPLPATAQAAASGTDSKKEEKKEEEKKEEEKKEEQKKADTITTLEMTPNSTESTFVYASVTYKTSLVEIEAHKKMYAPGEIVAEIQISSSVKIDQGTDKSWYMFSQFTLQSIFGNRKVELLEDSNYLAQGYYVHEVIPHYKKDSLYVTLKAYSPDYLLTVDSYCRSFVAKRLYYDVMKGEMANFKLPYDKEKTVASLLKMNTLINLGSTSKEQILPYLVQFNEPLHNLLVRTANRWGELFFYEGEHLNFGYTQASANKKMSIADTVSVTYKNIQTDSPVDVTLLSHNTTTPATYSGAFGATGDAKPKGKFVDEATTDEYRGLVKNEDEYYDQVVGEIRGATTGVYMWKKVGQLFTGAGTLFDWLITFLVDDLISWGQANEKNKNKNKKYKDKYFKAADDTKGMSAEQYDNSTVSSAKRFYPFATDHEIAVTTGPSAATYNAVVTNERHAGKDLIEIDLGANYKHVTLGDVFSFDGDGWKKEYMVIGIDCVTVTTKTLGVENFMPVEKFSKSQQFRITAVKKQEGGWYPPIHEAGHVRQSAPQVAFVADTDDPTRNRRYRVKYTWQDADDLASPWIAVSNPASTADGGAFFLHQKDDEVLLNYEGGNIERPYIVGALQKQTPTADKETTVHMATRKNYAVLSTPAGHRITMSDGAGTGVGAFLMNMTPITKLIKGFWVDMPKTDDAESKKYEGDIEITDANGLFSIKGSSDDRNVTIKSIFGDVKINAFTGITVSAPNGDVKIQGKNVTIEAGNNLTLKSGANIASGFMGKVHLGKFTAADVAKAAVEATSKAAVNKVMSYLDFSMLRHVAETFLRPIEGTLEVKSNRYLKLESGKGEAAVPVTAYQRTYAEKKTETSVPKGVFDTFNLVETIAGNLVHRIRSIHDRCNSCFESYQNLSAQYPDSCISATDLVGVLYGKDNENDVKDADLQFKGVLGVEDADIDSAVLKKSVVRRANESDENYKERIKTFRNRTRNSLKRKAKLLAGNILAMKAFIGGAAIAYAVQAREGCDTTKLNAAISKANCLDDGNQGMLHQLRNNLAQVINNPVDDNTYAPTKTRLKRVIFMNLVKEYNLPRQAIGDLKQIPPEPAVNVSVIDVDAWTKYADSVLCEQDNEKEKPGLMGTLKKTATDNLKKNVFFWSNLADHKVWGPEKNGAILFSSGPATHVLGKEIYRANVDFSSTVKYGEDPNDAHTGYTDLLHEIMKG